VIALACALALARDLPDEPVPHRPFDVQHLDLDVRLDLEARTVDGVVTLQARRRSAGALELHQVGLDIAEVTVDGQAVPVRTRDHRLLVPVPADRVETEVVVRYRASPSLGLHFRGGPDAPAGEPLSVHSQGEDTDHRYWFPSFDHPSDRFTVHTTVEVREGLGAWAVGTPQPRESTDDGWVRHPFHLDEPVANYLIAVVAGELQEAPLPGDSPVPLTVIADDPSAWVDSLASTGPALQWLATTLDEPVPYAPFRQAAVPRFLYGGMENPGLVVLTDEARLHGPNDVDESLRRLVAHEAAHQWFGDLVTCYGWRELWLNEGFATWYAARWLARQEGEAYLAEQVLRWHEASLRDEAAVSPRPPGDTSRPYAKVYVQGASVLHLLEDTLGREALDGAVAAYLDRHRGELVDSHQLRRVLEEHTGHGLSHLFSAFLHEPGFATLHTSHEVRDGQLEISVHQPEGPDARAPLQLTTEVLVGWPDRVERHPLRLDGGTRTLVLPVDTDPSYVFVDPRGALLARWTREQPVDAWVLQARHAPDPFARLSALRALGDQADTTEAVDAVAARLADRTLSRSERRVAAQALGSLPLQRAASALAAVLPTDDPWIDLAVVEALQEHGERAPRDVLVSMARSHSGDAAAAALRALGHTHPTTALPMARRVLQRPDPTPDARFRAAAADVIGQAGTKGDLAVLVPLLRAQTPRRALYRVIDATARRAKPFAADAPLRRRAAAALLELAEQSELRVARRAIAALPRVGSADDADALDALATRIADFQGLRAATRDAATALRTPPHEAPPDLRDLRSLQTELDALRDRVEALERYGG
jgi:aminopeptidase N